MSLFDIGRAEVICERMTLPELRMLGRTIRGEITIASRSSSSYPLTGPATGTWSQDRLWHKGLIDYYDRRWGYWEWVSTAPTMLGREVYELARQRWIDRHQRKPKQEGCDGECDG